MFQGLNIVTDDYGDLLRLPGDVEPVDYQIVIHPDLETGKYSGDINITIKVFDIISEVILHSDGLVIDSARVYSNIGTSSQVTHPVENVLIQKRNQLIIVRLSGNLNPGVHSLLLGFSGELNSEPVGFYRSLTSNAGDTPKYCALTYFEPTYARCAFPCFDEPRFKSTFTISLVRPSTDDYIALSNGEFESEILDYPSDGWTTVQFMKTVPMSSYLVCFVIGVFSRLEPAKACSDSVPVCVYSRPDLVEYTVFARDLAATVIDFFSDYFKIEYPFTKCDLIAIPNSKIGGMENVGLITFRERCLLIDPCESSAKDYTRATTIISHELSHMWFGDLVTMEWWDDLWLKEGMADFMASVVSQYCFPTWYKETTFLKHEYFPVLVKDSALSSHPIINPVNKPGEISSMFDDISYLKGACVLRMMHNLEPGKFQSGIRCYLSNHKFSTTVSSDLWTALKAMDITAIEIDSLMECWTQQSGYPLVSVQISKNRMEMRQTRFLSDCDAQYNAYDSPFRYRWDIPIKYISSVNPEVVELQWFFKDDDVISLELKSETKWFKLNWHSVGFYRVNYSLEMWKEFSNILLDNPERFDPEDRCGLVNDAFCLANAGYIEYKIPLTLILYLKNGKEDNPLIWFVVVCNLRKINNFIKKTKTAPFFKIYLDVVMRSVLSSVQFKIDEDIPHLERLLRIEQIRGLCLLGYEEPLEKVKSIYKEWMDMKKCHPSSDLKEIVYQFGMYGEDVNDIWEATWNVFLQENDPMESSKLLQALASAQSETLLKRLLTEIKNPDVIKSEDFFMVLIYISENPCGNSLVWEFLKTEWNYIEERFSTNDRNLGTIISHVTSDFCTPEELTDVENFFATNSNVGANECERKHAIEIIKANIIWFKRNYEFIDNWFQYFASKLEA